MGEDVRGLQIQLSAALRERDEARTAAREEEKRADGWESTANANGELAAGHYSRWKAAESERDALRAENGRLVNALNRIGHGINCEAWEAMVLQMREVARAALASGGEDGR